jgi:hypothetical protein
MDIINRGIDRSIDAQRAEYEKAKDKVALANNAYAILRQNGLDDRQAALGVKQRLLETFQGQTDAMAAKYTAPLIKSNAQILKNNLQKEFLNTQIQQYLASRPKSEVTSTYQTATPTGKFPGKLRELPAEQAAKLGGIHAAKMQVENILSQYVQKAAKVGDALVQFIPQTDAHNYNQAKQGMIATVGRALGEKGQFTEGDFERYFGALPKPTDTMTTAQYKIKVIRENMDNLFRGEIEAFRGAGFDVEGIVQRLRDPNELAKSLGATKKE